MIIGGRINEGLISLEATIENYNICSECGGGCCKTKDVVIPLSNYDLGRIPDNLVTDLDDLPIMKRSDKGCSALNNGGCSIFDERPFYCRIYPIKLVSIVESSIWNSYHVTGYAFILDNCALKNGIDFESEVDRTIKELEKDPVLLERLKTVADKYCQVVGSHLNETYSAYRLI